MTAPARVILSETVTSLLRSLTAKTGLSANILARFAMLMSFEEPDTPATDNGKAGLTINRMTLFGELEPFLMSAFVLSPHYRGNSTNVSKDFANHIARGVARLNVRIQSLSDLAVLVCDIS